MAMRVGHKLGREDGAIILEILARKENFALCKLKVRDRVTEDYFSICVRLGKRWYVVSPNVEWPYPVLIDMMADLPAEIRTTIALFELEDEVKLDALDLAAKEGKGY